MVVGQYVLHAMQIAGVAKAYFVVSVYKWEILKYFMSGAHLGIDLGYLCQDEPRGMPGALDVAYRWVADQTVMMGMPDTILEPSDCFARLLTFHNRKSSDLSLGVFPVPNPHTLAPVHIDTKTERVTQIFDKPAQTNLFNTWGIAIWSARFSDLLHLYVQAHQTDENTPELLLSDVFLEAIRQGLNVYGHLFPDGKYYDVGTPEGLMHTRFALEHAQAKPYLR